MTILNLIKIAENSPNGSLWEKEKLLFTGNFSFSYSVFKHWFVLQTRKNQGLFGKGFTFKLLSKTPGRFVDSVDQDQTA